MHRLPRFCLLYVGRIDETVDPHQLSGTLGAVIILGWVGVLRTSRADMIFLSFIIDIRA